MRINHLALKNFRNYDFASFTFSPSTNVLIGKNAQGKTNLIEAIYLLSIAKSFRTRSTQELIQFNKEYARILGNVESHHIQRDLEMILFEDGKQAKVNGSKCAKTSEFVGYFNVVVFTPDDLFFVKGSPKNRRRFMDIELAKISPAYLSYLNAYQHYLKERNQYFKKVNFTQKKDDVYLSIITDQMLDATLQIASRRKSFIQQINARAKKIYQKIAGVDEEIDISYRTFFDVDNTTKDELIEYYKKQEDRDYKFAITNQGIHKDDLNILINGKDAAQFASQGQQRTIVLALKIALLQYIYHEIGEYPVLLLDDVLSELDVSRQNLLLDLVSHDIQTFITTTSIEGIEHEVIKKATKIEIKQERSQ